MDRELFRMGHLNIFKSRFRQTLSTLPYIEGQKYTFGLVYPKDDDQNKDDGEFIFLQTGFYMEISKIRPPHFQIACRNETFWIRDLNYYCTFLNNMAVTGRETEIKIGDFLHIIFAQELKEERGKQLVQKWDQWSHPYNFALFLFQERMWRNYKDGFEGERILRIDCTARSEALENTLILSEIFSNLSAATLKNCRLVCHTWMVEGRKRLKLLTEVVLTSCNPQCQSEVIRRPLTMFFLYLEEMERFRHPNWKVDFEPEYRDLRMNMLAHSDPRLVMVGVPRKMGKDLDNFFEPYGETRYFPVVRLRLELPRYSYNFETRARKILSSVRNTLESLEICPNARIVGEGGNGNEDEFPDVDLPHLKDLSLNLGLNHGFLAKVIDQFRSRLRCLNIYLRFNLDDEMLESQVKFLRDLDFVGFTCLEKLVIRGGESNAGFLMQSLQRARQELLNRFQEFRR